MQESRQQEQSNRKFFSYHGEGDEIPKQDDQPSLNKNQNKERPITWGYRLDQQGHRERKDNMQMKELMRLREMKPGR